MIKNGLFGALSMLVALLFLDITAFAEGVAIFALIFTGPVLFGVYMVYVSKSNNNDLNIADPGHRLPFYGTIGAMILSVGAIALYLINNPALIWS